MVNSSQHNTVDVMETTMIPGRTYRPKISILDKLCVSAQAVVMVLIANINRPGSQGEGVASVGPTWAITGGPRTGSQGVCGLCGQGEA
jgi:hypothetical protein